MKKPFTLVEVLVAMSILSVFLLGLMQFYSSTESMLSAGIERTEMFERARIAMDMMANDLVCAYYSQSSKQKSKSIVADGSTLKIATVRPEKLDAAKTNVVGVKYVWDDNKRSLDYTFDKKGDNFDISKPFKEESKKAHLVEGVSKFEVEAFAKNSDTLPALVVIRMELVDARTMRRYKANKNNEEILKNAPTREFRRMIIIDRGQPKPDNLASHFVEGS